MFRRDAPASPLPAAQAQYRRPVAGSCERVQADFQLVASALQRLLTQWPADVTARHFPLATSACKALRRQARVGVELALPAELLSDLCHEIAVHVEAPVRQAALRCLRHAARAPLVFPAGRPWAP
jgi:hypothetical protein